MDILSGHGQAGVLAHLMSVPGESDRQRVLGHIVHALRVHLWKASGVSRAISSHLRCLPSAPSLVLSVYLGRSGVLGIAFDLGYHGMPVSAVESFPALLGLLSPGTWYSVLFPVGGSIMRRRGTGTFDDYVGSSTLKICFCLFHVVKLQKGLR